MQAEDLKPTDTRLTVVPALAHPIVIPQALTREQCAAVVAMGQAHPSDVAHAIGDESRSRAARVGSLAWLLPNEANYWLYDCVRNLFERVRDIYHVDIHGMVDPLQFTGYSSGARFDWHSDIGADETVARKISLTVQLTDPTAYEGGALEFHNGQEMPIARELGSATLFPSFMAHRVTSITSGTRYSLVAWASGPGWR